MKGGNLLVLEAIRQLVRAGIETPLPVTVLFTSDEGVGSPSTRDLIEAEASRHAAVLVPEPGGPGHEVTTGRYAIARFAIETTGRPSHAGARLSEGRSAIYAMARRIIEIEGMTTEDCTFSVGVIRGGEWVNCVASTCTAQVLSMAKRQADLDRGVERMLALAGRDNDVRFDVGWRTYAGRAPSGGQPRPAGTAAGWPARDIHGFVAARWGWNEADRRGLPRFHRYARRSIDCVVAVAAVHFLGRRCISLLSGSLQWRDNDHAWRRLMDGWSGSEDKVRVRAYHLWEAEGRPEGREGEFWTRTIQLEQQESAAGQVSGLT